jgi:adenylate cyclase
MEKWNLKMLTIPKYIYIDIIEKLSWVGAKGVGFDIVFQNADEDEERFASTLEKYPNIVIAGQYLRNPSCQSDVWGQYTNCEGMPRSVYAWANWGIINLENPYERLLESDIGGTPYASWKEKKNTEVRRSDMMIRTLPLALYEKGNPPIYLPSRLSTFGSTIINPYFGPQWSYSSISLSEVLKMNKIELVKNFGWKYVFIGESGTLIHDTIPSPVTGDDMHGVESHAHFLDGLLQDRMLSSLGTSGMLVSILLISLIMVIVYTLVPTFLSPIIAIATMIAILYGSRILYDIGRTVVDIFPLFLAGGILSYPVTYMYRYFVVDREKRALQNNFAHYIDPHVVDDIVAHGWAIELGGERRNLSILFSDIAGFTTISETLAPQDLFYLMTSYLSNMTDILIKEGGTLDKYIGDAVMGFFGAPMTYDDDARRACRTALLMRKELPGFNEDIGVHGIAPIDFRVGIASGDVMVGNIGSHDRFNYTVLGDTVNLASRLESSGKEYDVHIIVSGSTRDEAGEEFLYRELDTIAVKWKNEGIRIYELLGFYADMLDMTVYASYESALDLYRKWQYREAGKLWEKYMEIDGPSRVMALRTLDILSGKITITGGIYRMEHK